MPTYAILGATGQCGGSLVEVLSKDPQNRIHAYVRSKSKLLKKNPGLEKDPRFEIYEGNLDDIKLLANCLSGTRAAFLAVAETENRPECSIAQDTTRSVLAALDHLRKQDADCELPRLVVLSSASLDEIFCRDLPPMVYGIVFRAFSNIYGDLRKAETLLRSREDFVNSTFVKPGVLTHDRQKGHELSTERQGKNFLSFLDLAAGMVEVTETNDGRWDQVNVSVLPTAKKTKVEWAVPWYIVKGLFFHYFPWMWPYLMG
jgi:putative NADH-flavin reductase